MNDVHGRYFVGKWPATYAVLLLSIFFLNACCLRMCGACCAQCSYGCAWRAIEKREFSAENPMEWVFSANAEQVRACILTRQQGEKKNYFYTLDYGEKGTRLASIKLPDEYRSLHRASESPSDIYFRVGSSSSQYESFRYFRCGEPMEYHATYRLRVTANDDGKALASVIHDGAWILAYREFRMNPHSLTKRMQPGIPSEGIDEYAILREIGECLGVLDEMPPLQLPEGDLVTCPECPQGLQPSDGFFDL